MDAIFKLVESIFSDASLHSTLLSDEKVMDAAATKAYSRGLINCLFQLYLSSQKDKQECNLANCTPSPTTEWEKGVTARVSRRVQELGEGVYDRDRESSHLRRRDLWMSEHCQPPSV